MDQDKVILCNKNDGDVAIVIISFTISFLCATKIIFFVNI